MDLRRPIVHRRWRISIDDKNKSVQIMMPKVECVQRSISAERASRRVCDGRLTLACLRLDNQRDVKTVNTDNAI